MGVVEPFVRLLGVLTRCLSSPPSVKSWPRAHAFTVDHVRDPLLPPESDLHLNNTSLNSSLYSKNRFRKNAAEQI
jgi:hypothetical protein